MVTLFAGENSQVPSPPTTITTSVMSRNRFGLGMAAISPRLNSGSALPIRWSIFAWMNGAVRMLTRLPKSRAWSPPAWVRSRPVRALISSTSQRIARKPTLSAAARPSGLASEPSSSGRGSGVLGRVLTTRKYSPFPGGAQSETRSRFVAHAHLDAVQQAGQPGVEGLRGRLLLVRHGLVGQREPADRGDLRDHREALVEVRGHLREQGRSGVPPLLVAGPGGGRRVAGLGHDLRDRPHELEQRTGQAAHLHRSEAALEQDAQDGVQH